MVRVMTSRNNEILCEDRYYAHRDYVVKSMVFA